MTHDDDIIDLFSLDDGCYALANGHGSYSEAVKYPIAKWNRLYVNKIRLPDGTGNIVYLLTDTFQNTFRLINGQNFIVPANYRKIFYPPVSYGTFFGKRYKLNLIKERSARINMIKANSKLVPSPGKKLTEGDTMNTFFALADLFTATVATGTNLQAKRISQEYWGQFGKLIKGMTPTAKIPPTNPASDNRIMIIDAEAFAFKPGASLTENKLNPLFMIYLTYFRTRDLSQLKFDIPILITAKNMFMKFNPANITKHDFNLFRTGLFRIMKTNLDEYTAGLSDLERGEININAGDITVGAAVDAVVDSVTKYNSPAVKSSLVSAVSDALHAKAVKHVADADITNKAKLAVSKSAEPDLSQKTIAPTGAIVQPAPIAQRPDQRRAAELDRLFRSIVNNQRQSLTTDTDEDLPEDNVDGVDVELEEEIIHILGSDPTVAEEIDNVIQDTIVPMRNPAKAPVNSARDAKLREAQRKVVVNNSTIGEILAKESSKIPILVEDKSKVMTTTNPAMKTIAFGNFDKSYQDNLLNRDIVACFDALKDKPVPLFIKSITVTDSSTAADLKETWVVTLVDQLGKNHPVTVDIPKFYQNRFLYLERNRYVILKQNMFLPIVKDTPDTVLVTSSNRKVTVTRKSGKEMTLSQVSRLFKLITKISDDKMFIPGDSTKINTSRQYVSTLEFDEIGRRLFQFSSGNTRLYFNRTYISNTIAPDFPGTINDDEFLIGFVGNEPICINDTTGRDRKGRTICEIIEASLTPEATSMLHKIKSAKQSVYVEAKMAGTFLPIGVILMIWHGLKHVLTAMDIDWQFHTGVKKLPDRSGYDHIKFSDGILEYRADMFAQLILNGLTAVDPASFTFQDFESEAGYYEYLHKVTGTYTFRSQLMTFRDFFVDPITEEVCRDLQLPWEVDKLMIHAVKLLCDNAHKSKVYDGFYRLRSTEIIPSILYSEIVAQYQRWLNAGQRNKFSLAPNIVIKDLMAQQTVENYSILNPATEVGKLSTVSAKGLAGSNVNRAYNNEEKRSYDPSSIGKIAMSSSPDANIGITRELVVEPTITNARGYRTMVDADNIDEMIDVNIFSPVELLTPGTANGDDPTRVAIANKQTKHQVPVVDAVPALVSNGYDEAIQFHLSNDFVVNAEEDGEVVEYDEAAGMIMVKYKSGKCQAVSISPELVQNSGSGFFLSYTMKSTVKVGDKVTKDQVIAYHDRYFNHSKMNGLRHSVGPLVKIAFMSTYNTYEDANLCTNKLSNMLETSIAYQQDAPLTRVADVLSIVKVGDVVRVNDPLIRYEVVADDANIANFISKLPSDESKELIADMGKTGVFAEHSGKIVKIRVTSLIDPNDMTPTLAAVVNQYWGENQSRQDLLSKYDDTPGIIKAGYMMTDATGVYKNRYNRIGHYDNKDVVIEFFIDHSFVAGVGDKLAIYGANKVIISEMIEPGYEPFSEHHPEEEVSIISSPGTVARRMTPTVLPISMAMKCLIELKRELKEIAKF